MASNWPEIRVNSDARVAIGWNGGPFIVLTQSRLDKLIVALDSNGWLTKQGELHLKRLSSSGAVDDFRK